MDQAIYEPVSGKIFGVRGQWVFRFNAASGALEASARFSQYPTGRSCLCTSGGLLYCASNYSPAFDGKDIYINGWTRPDIYRVDSTLAVIGKLNVSSNWSFGAGDSQFDSNTRQIFSISTNGTNIFGYVPDSGGFLINLDGSNYKEGIGVNVEDTVYDSVNGVYWLIENAIGGGVVDIGVQDPASKFNYGYSATTDTPVGGVTYSALQNKVYAATGTEALLEFSAADAISAPLTFNSLWALNTLHTSRINCTAFRVKACNVIGNPYYGKVLVPAWNDDTVLVWDAASDNPGNMVVKSGFTAPVDVLYTPTKAWAVQTGVTALKEIT